MKKILIIIVTFICIIIALSVQLNIDKTKQSNVIGRDFEFSNLKNIYNGSPLLIRKNKPVLVHVFASWCSNCKKDLPKIAELKKKHNLQVVGLLWQDKIANVKKHPKEYEAYDVITFDPKDRLAFEMGITGAPETFLISSDGVVVYNDKGDLKEEDLLNALQIEFR